MNDPIEKVELKSNCTLVLMGLQSFCWDAAKCDGSLKVSNYTRRAKQTRLYLPDHSFLEKDFITYSIF